MVGDVNDISMSQGIRWFRINRGLTVEELAYDSGLEKSQISKIENMRRSLTMNQFKSILSALDVTMEDFFCTVKEIYG